MHFTLTYVVVIIASDEALLMPSHSLAIFRQFDFSFSCLLLDTDHALTNYRLLH